jgi:hypothetical protein
MRQRIPQGAKAAATQHGGPRERERERERDSSLDRSSGTTGSASGSWGKTSDDAGETSAIPNPVPMFNPLHHHPAHAHAHAHHHPYASYKKEYDIPAAPLSWQHPSATSTGIGTGTSGLMIPAAPNSFAGLRTSQLPSLAPPFIPDSKYHAYLMGQPWKKKAKPVITKICLANFCVMFSVVAVMFLLFVGILIDRQPLYIPKVLPKHTQYTTGDRRPKTFYTVLLSERLVPASNAYATAGCYFLTGFLSYAYLNNFWGLFQHYHQRRRRSLYQDIPDTDSTTPNIPGLFDDATGELPTTVHSPVMRAYQYNNKLALSQRVCESVSLTTHRIGMYLATVWPRFKDRRRSARRRYTGAKDI